ncbi:MAG TPA: hypothetical protein VFN43_10655 [Humibacillus sp.]|nr:hypothetical protein [Humibacillus sp.]
MATEAGVAGGHRAGDLASVRASAPDASDDTHDEAPWLLRDPLRAVAIVVTVIALGVRLSVVKDSFFITDDFMLSARAVENSLGWDYLTRVHTGHFEPIGFGVMWLLAHLAPLNWTVAVIVLMTGQVVLAVLVWSLLVELFGRRWLVLLPYGIFCLTPLTLPAFTWLSAAIIWLPLMIAIAGGLRSHTRYVRDGRARDAVLAVIWLVVGLASFEKIVIFLPYLVFFTLAISPGARRGLRSVWAIFRRTAPVWIGYLGAFVLYLVLYLPGVRSAGNDSPVTPPPAGPLTDFVYLSVFRTFIPGPFGGPWDWQPTSYALAIVDSPRAFDWVMWILAAIVLCGSLLVRRHVGRFWLALAVYLLGSLATIAAGRVAYGGAIVALETRYLADATVPLVVTLGACLMPLRDETHPWTATGRDLLSAVPRRAGVIGAVALAALVTGLSFDAMGNYARCSTGNPARAFVTNTTTSLDRLPADARVWDTEVPGGIIGPLFAQYNLTSRYLSPLLDEQTRADARTRRTFVNPYILDPQGSLVPMGLSQVATSVPHTGCYTATDRTIEVPLTQPVAEWGWAVRLGYLADQSTVASVSLGDDTVSVPFAKGLGEVWVSFVSAGDRITVSGLAPGVNFCIGDAQVGFPAPAPTS